MHPEVTILLLLLHPIKFEAYTRADYLGLPVQGNSFTKFNVSVIRDPDTQDVGPKGFPVRNAIDQAVIAAHDLFHVDLVINQTYAMPTSCVDGPNSDWMAFLYAFDYIRNGAQAILGPSCTSWFLASGVATSAYDTIQVTGGADEIAPITFQAFPYLTRTNYNKRTQIYLFLYFMGARGWNKIGFFYDADDHTRVSDYDRFHEIDVTRKAVDTQYVAVHGNTIIDQDIKAYLIQASKVCRIIGLFFKSSLLDAFLRQAAQLNMVTGEYVYFTVDRFGEVVGMPDLPASVYSNLLITSLTDKSQNRIYQANLKKITDQNPTFQMNYYVGTYYNALIVLAYSILLFVVQYPGVDTTTSQAGKIIATIAYNKTIPHGFSGIFFIDWTGDIQEDYTMSAFIDGSFVPVWQYWGLNDSVTPFSERLKWNTADGSWPKDEPDCGFTGSKCPDTSMTIIGITVPLVGILIVYLFIMGRRYRRRVKLDKAWVAHWVDLKVYNPDAVHIPARAKKSIEVTKSKSGYDAVSIGEGGPEVSVSISSPSGGRWRKQLVTIRWMKKKSVRITEKVLIDVRTVNKVKHENVMKFVGACVERGHVVVFYECCSRGSLEEIITNPTSNFEWPLRFSFINDIVRGMYYVHTTSVYKVHGRLTSAACFVDSRFTLKIADVGLSSFFELNIAEFWLQKRQPGFYESQLWTAPELIREQESDQSQVLHSYTPEGDIYSFSIILQEIILKCRPYEMYDETPQRIYGRLRQHQTPGSKPFRPVIDESACHADLIPLCARCWSESVIERPTFNQVRVVLRDIVKSLGMGDRLNILDALIQQMEEHTANLQGIIEEKEQLVFQQKTRADKLLFSNLPKIMADVLMRGEVLDPTYLDVCSIMVVDVMNFDAVMAVSSAEDTATFLTDLHGYYFTASQKFDCYILESYTPRITVASGLPVRNGILHARELGRLALTMLFQSKQLPIRHMPETEIQIRFGIHSGPIVFGVVGQHVPRFCLFGETQNIAMRIMSVEEAYKVRLSAATRNIMEAFGSFRAFDSDEIFVKGKGRMKTYSLVGEDGNTELMESQKTFYGEEHEDGNEM